MIFWTGQVIGGGKGEGSVYKSLISEACFWRACFNRYVAKRG